MKLSNKSSKINALVAIGLGALSACMFSKEIVALGLLASLVLVGSAALAGTVVAVSKR